MGFISVSLDTVLKKARRTMVWYVYNLPSLADYSKNTEKEINRSLITQLKYKKCSPAVFTLQIKLISLPFHILNVIYLPLSLSQKKTSASCNIVAFVNKTRDWFTGLWVSSKPEGTTRLVSRRRNQRQAVLPLTCKELVRYS